MKRNMIPMPMEKWIKYVLLVLSCIVLTRICYILFRGEIDKEYFTSGVYEGETETITCDKLSQIFSVNESRLNSVELCFGGIEEDNSGIVILTITAGDDILYQTNLTLNDSDNGTWEKVFINAEMQPGKEYTLLLDANDSWEKSPEILVACDSYAGEIKGSFQDNEPLENNLAVKYGYLRVPSLFDRLVIISLWLLGFAAVCYFILHANTINRRFRSSADHTAEQIGETVFISIHELLLIQIVISCSGLELQNLTKVLLCLISIMISLNYTEKNVYANEICNTKGKQAAFLLLCAYTAFALVGQRLFIYPMSKKVSIGELAVFLCAFQWCVPAVKSTFYCFERLTSLCFGPGRTMRTWMFVLICLLVLLLPAAYNLIANNPVIADVDTYESFEKNAQNLYGMYNWHPAFYSLILHKLQQVWNSTYMVILVQYFFWGYVLTEMLLFLRSKGMRDGALLVVAFLFGINAANMLHLNTIWKDVPYTYALLWVVVLLAKLSSDPEKYKKKWYFYLELFIALLLVSMLRKNGIVIFAVCGFTLAIVFRRNLKVLVTVAAVIATMLYIKGPIYDRYQLVEPGRRGIYIGLGQDILGAYYGGGEVSEDTLKMINVMTHQNNMEFDYNPTWAHQSYDLDVEPLHFIFCYIDTFVKNPILVTRTILDREDALWDIFRGEDAIVENTNFTSTIDGYLRWNEFYPERVFRSIEPGMSRFTKKTTEIQWIDVLTWRCGFLTLMALVSTAYVMMKKRDNRALIIISPAIGQILSLLLSTGWTDFRYFWPMNVLNLALFFLLMALISDKRSEIV